MRLDKYISDSAAYSRREIKKQIKAGAVTVNGEAARAAEQRVTESDEVAINGTAVRYKRFVYLMLNKPAGYVSATEDRHYPVVTDLVPEEYRHFDVSPVGRLDIDTEGLLLLTNDGEFNHALTSPSKNVYKRYFARLDKPAEEKDIGAFAEGMEFKDFAARPARLEICADAHEAFVEIAEGKFHQVKRMFERVGKTVVYLKRVAVGGLALPDDLQSGSVREYTIDELNTMIKGDSNS